MPDLSHDEAARAAVEHAQAARDLRVKQFWDEHDSPVTFGEMLRGLGHMLHGETLHDVPDVVRDVDIKERRDERLADRPQERELKLQMKAARNPYDAATLKRLGRGLRILRRGRSWNR